MNIFFRITVCGFMSSALAAISCSSGNITVLRENRILMGTVVEIAIGGEDQETARRAIDAAFAEIERVDAMMSRHRPESHLSRVNADGGAGMVRVPEELFTVIEQAGAFWSHSGGAFDATVGPLTALWSFDSGGVVPPAEKIHEAMVKVGQDKLLLDKESRSVGFGVNGMSVDLGGIAKGHAIDSAVQRLEGMGIRSAIVDAGGDMRLIGGRPGKGHWRIGIQHPREPGRLLVSLDLSDTAVVTSGDYERFFIAGGERYHHVLDPSTGRPARGCQSVTVIAPSASEADACATAAFVLGPERGLEFLRSRPGVRGLIVDAGGGLHWTDEQLARAARR